MRRGSRNKRVVTVRGNEKVSFTLMVHGAEYGAGEELLHDLLEITQPEREQERLVLQVTSLAPVRGKLQISVLKDVAALFGLEAFLNVTVQKVDPRDVTVDFVEITFKDQFLSRADIWRYKVAMFGKCVYVGKTVESLGIRSQVEGLVAGNQSLMCGVVGADTKLIVRSRSSRLFWLVQMSTEMWEFAPDGELYYEKLLTRLLRVLVHKWNENSVSHSVTIIAFSRSYYDRNQFPDSFNPADPLFREPFRQGFGPGCTSPDAYMAHGHGPTIHIEPESGRYYEDFYKVLVMNYTGPDWTQLLAVLKKEFAQYHIAHRWRLPEEFMPAEYEIREQPVVASPATATGQQMVQSVAADTTGDAEQGSARTQRYVQWKVLPYGVPSRAVHGNILEAINVTLNILDKHYMDRDLSRTGQSIVMITAGSSIFHVDQRLSQITKQRMMDNGVGMDMISLTTPPLHVVPLFICHRSTATTPSNQEVDDDTPPHSTMPELLDRRMRPSVMGSTKSPTGLDRMSLEMCSLHEYQTLLSDFDSLPSFLFDTDGDNRTPVSPTAVAYMVPHWVNITFLDFDCHCGADVGSNQAAHLPTSPTAPAGYASSRLYLPAGTRLQSHRCYVCECQLRLNQRFQPLPPFRMFDLTAPTEKLVFPVTLKKMMQASPRKVGRAPVSSSYGASSIDDSSPRLSVSGPKSRRRRMSDMSDVISSNSSLVPPEQWQICKSPDIDFVLSPHGLQSYPSSLSASLTTREALLEYDAAVFRPTRQAFGGHSSPVLHPASPGGGQNNSTHGGGVGSATLTSEYFVGGGGGADSRNPRMSKAGSITQRPGGIRGMASTSMLGSLLSPRNEALVLGPLGKSNGLPQRRLCFLHASYHRGYQRPAQQQEHNVETSSSLTVNAAQLLVNESQFPHLSRAMTMNKASPNYTRSPPPLYPPPSVLQAASGATFSPSSEYYAPGTQNMRALGPPPPVHPSMRRGTSDMGTSLPSAVGGVTMPTSTTNSGFINPFKYSMETLDETPHKLTSDRRRWSHLFPTMLADHVAMGFKVLHLGPNWKSLTSPAILPLTTDFYPSPKDLHTSYTESFYTLTLPSTDIFPKYRNHNELLVEMVCQRLASDFQLVATDAGTDVVVTRLRVPAGTTNRGPSGESRDSQSRTIVYHLSMGHRIHQMIYDEDLQTIEVKRYFQRASQRQHNEPRTYSYSLWGEFIQAFQPCQQKFYEYPQPEDNWNSVDHLLCGYHDDMTDLIKCRRIRFAIVPPRIDVKTSADSKASSEASCDTYTARFMKFIDYLQSRVAIVQDDAKIVIKVLDKPEPGARASTRTFSGFKIGCNSTSSSSSSSRIKLAEDCRNEWVMLMMEDCMEVSRNYHFDVRWLACSGIAAEDFIATLKRKAKQTSLELRRVPEYSCISFLQIHPLIAPIYLPAPVVLATTKVIGERSFTDMLVSKLDFVFDDQRLADINGIGYGLGIGREEKSTGGPDGAIAKPYSRFQRRFATPAANEARLAERWRLRGYRQYMHRALPVFLRVIQTGVVWIPSYDYDERSDPQRTKDLFVAVCDLIEEFS
ncbi:TPA: LOW QUALITY PROTEIN: hypothetical protein N0F65_001385 [Lagenidium giganteum]|uniref:Vacuolar membrane-associated protein iml1 n=1 Tax=Lagenidium giganteum TaxID=4803 RepID=A0AAV2Z0D9_9STRA|nr:TPA: LOW QUALITY PROTEIN: hypothetical protein N0F65_001385 [Lagenidium giganteum]